MSLLASAPPTSPDFVNRAILMSGIVFVAVGGLIVWKRGKLIESKRQMATIHYFFEAAEWVLAIAISIAASFFELYKVDTWQKAQSSLVGSSTLLSALIASYLGVKAISAAAKKRDALEIEAMKVEKTKLEEAVRVEALTRANVEAQRNGLLEISALVRKVVDSKMGRMVQGLSGKANLQAGDIVKALDPQGQISIIIRTIFVYFERKKKTGEQLRLGIYERDPADRNALRRVYSWNGDTTECFNRNGQDLGKLDDPEGMPTQLVRIYHSSKRILIIESCSRQAELGNFHLFPGQQTYLRSMILYKHVFDDHGTKSALILTLDSSEDGLFREKDEQELEILLLEMMKRVEFEMKCVETFVRT